MAKWLVVCVNEVGVVVSRHKSRPAGLPPAGCLFVVFDTPRAVRLGSRVDTGWKDEGGLGGMQGRGAT